MLAQGRAVAPERMTWETLDPEDRLLDDGIAARLRATLDAARQSAPATEDEVARLRAAIDTMEPPKMRGYRTDPVDAFADGFGVALDAVLDALAKPAP